MRRFAAIALLLSAAGVVVGAKPGMWTHSTEADFAAGKLDKTVVTSLGEVTLARRLATIVEPSEEMGAISAMAMDPRGRVYLATAPKATVYRLDKGKAVELAELPGVLVRALLCEGDTVLAGTCGEGAGIYRIDAKGKVTKVWADAEVKSVWAIVPGPAKGYYAATGPEGRVYQVSADGAAKIIYDGEEKNILSLIRGPKPGLLYAGSGENGLIIEIDAATKSGRVLYDAKEKEISALSLGADGVLYAATSDTTKAGADGESPSRQVKGKPDNGPTSRPAPKAVKKPDVKKPVVKAAPPKPDKTEPPKPDKTEPPKPNKMEPPQPKQTRPTPKPKITPPSGSKPPPRGPSGGGKGNAVYRIDPSGSVRAVFRRPATIFAMRLADGVLTLGTGHGGQLFEVQLADDRTTTLAKVDPKDITAMVADKAGKLHFATASKGGVFALAAERAETGTIISKEFDAKQVAGWGTVQVRADVPKGCKVTFAARSGNVAKADDKTWSPWSAETSLGDWSKIKAPPGRYLQYRLTLTGADGATPTVEQVRLVHQVQNLPPSISAVQVVASASAKAGKGAGPKRLRRITVKAADGNGDPLQYSFFFRRSGNKLWIKLAENATAGLYVWDTTGVGDGTYEVRAEVTDEAANSPASAGTDARISRAVVVDNTGPVVVDLAVKADGAGKLSLTGRVTDAASRITAIEYAVDSNKKWLALLAADGICDSRKESFAATVKDLDAGAHLVAVRVTDEYGNVGHASVEATVGK